MEYWCPQQRRCRLFRGPLLEKREKGRTRQYGSDRHLPAFHKRYLSKTLSRNHLFPTMHLIFSSVSPWASEKALTSTRPSQAECIQFSCPSNCVSHFRR